MSATGMKDHIGVIGKTELSDKETTLLTMLGRVIARAGKTLVTVPAKGTVAAVEMGNELEHGQLLHLEQGTINASAHTFIYADERLMSRLRKVNPDLDQRDDIFLLSQPIEIELWLEAARTVLTDKGIAFPE